MISIKDNDSLAARLAAEVEADLLILMSDVDGIYTCPPSEEGARLINTYTPENATSIQYGKKSRVGTGGMDSKVIGAGVASFGNRETRVPRTFRSADLKISSLENSRRRVQGFLGIVS